MGAFAGSLSMCQQITEALSSVVNHNALKIELFFFFFSGSITHMLQILICIRSCISTFEFAVCGEKMHI